MTPAAPVLTLAADARRGAVARGALVPRVAAPLTAGRVACCPTCGGLIVTPPATGAPIQADAEAAVLRDLAGARIECAEFFRVLWRDDPATHEPLHQVKQLACAFGIHATTLQTRFFRAGLPSPKVYLDRALLVRLARALEVQQRSFARVADDLGFAAPQNATRWLRRLTGQTVGAWRPTANGEAELARFRALLIAPYLAALRDFDPLSRRNIGRRPSSSSAGRR